MSIDFIYSFEEYLNEFKPYLKYEITMNSLYFSKNKGNVDLFVNEIKQTAKKLQLTYQAEKAQYYAALLLRQYEQLRNAVSKITVAKKKNPQFLSSFSFPRNIHTLPPKKRLDEYRKALRALNEKISWLTERGFQAENTEQKTQLQIQITETEYRKLKCLKAIEDLEEELNFK